MQKIETLRNKSGEAIYPLTSTKAVVDENGNTIEARLVVADGEDLVTDGNVLRLKDRPNTDGMGYVILRKDKTFQEQVTKPNTIYEIRYDFDLGRQEKAVVLDTPFVLPSTGGAYYRTGDHINVEAGMTVDLPSGGVLFDSTLSALIPAPYTPTSKKSLYVGKLQSEAALGQSCVYSLEKEVVIPENCVLKFEGGSLGNGTLKGVVNLIGDYLRHINIEIKGDNITENFGITNYDDNTIVNSHIGSALNGIVIYEDVNVGEECILKTSIKSPCKSKVFFNEYTRGFLLVGVNGVEINNINIVKSIPVTDNGIIRYRQNIYIENCSDINIENCILNGSIDIVSETEEQNNIIIDKNYFDCDFTNINDPGDNSVQKDVIQISGTSDIRITNNYIKSKNVNRVFKTSSRTKNYVDIDLLCKNIYIENNTIISESELGKQMYDMFCGVTNVFFRYNNVKIKGFTRVIENKSIDANIKSVIHIVGNYIEHDSPRGNNFYFSFKDDQHSFLNISNNTIITTNQGGQHSINFRGVNLQFNNNIYTGDNLSTFYFGNKANQNIYIENNTFSQSRFFVSENIEAESVNFISNKTSIIQEAFIYIYRQAVVNKINIVNNTYTSTYLLSVISNGEFNSNVQIVSPIYNSSAILQGDIDGDLLDKISCEGGLLYREGKGYKASDHSVSSLDALRALYKAKEGTIAKQGTNGDLCIKSSQDWIKFAKAVETKTTGTEEEKPVLTPHDKGYTYWNITTNCLNIWDGYRWVDADGIEYNKLKYGSYSSRPVGVPIGYMYFNTDNNTPMYWNGTEWAESDSKAAGIKRDGTWSQRPNADGSFLDNGFQYFLLESTPDTDPEGQPIESLTGNGKPIWWIQSSRKWVDAFGNTVTGGSDVVNKLLGQVNEVRHIINGEEYKFLTTDEESHSATIYAPTELGNDNYVVAQQNDKAVFVDPADIGLK